MEKLQAMQQQMEASKKKLDDVIVEGVSPQNLVTVKINGNRVVKSITFPENLGEMDHEELEDLLLIALNNGLQKAEAAYENEMKGAASGLMPGMGL